MPWKPAPRRSWGGGVAKKPTITPVVAPVKTQAELDAETEARRIKETSLMEEAARSQWSELMNVGAGGAPSAPTIVMGDAPPVEGITPPIEGEPIPQTEYVELSDGTRILKSEFDKLPVQAQIVGRYSGITALRGELDRYTAAQTYKQQQSIKAWEDAKKQAETEKAARTQAVNIQLKNSPELIPYFTEIDDEIAKVTTVLANSEGDDLATIEAMTKQLQELEDYRNALMGVVASLPQKTTTAEWIWDSEKKQFVQAPMGPESPSKEYLKAMNAYLAEMDRVRTLFSEVFHEADVEKMVELAADDPDRFLTEVRLMGMTPNSVKLLKEMFPNITEDEIADFFPKFGPEDTRLKDAFIALFPSVPLREFDSWVRSNPDELAKRIQQVGRNAQTEWFLEQIVKPLLPEDVKWDDFIDTIFTPPQKVGKTAAPSGVMNRIDLGKELKTYAPLNQPTAIDTIFTPPQKVGKTAAPSGVMNRIDLGKELKTYAPLNQPTALETWEAYQNLLKVFLGAAAASLTRVVPISSLQAKMNEIANRPGLTDGERYATLWEETNLPSSRSTKWTGPIGFLIDKLGYELPFSVGLKGAAELLIDPLSYLPVDVTVGLGGKIMAKLAARKQAEVIIKEEIGPLFVTTKGELVRMVDVAAKNLPDAEAAALAASQRKIINTIDSIAVKDVAKLDDAALRRIAETGDELDTLVQKQELLNKDGAVSDNVAQGIDAKVKELEALTKDLPDTPKPVETPPRPAVEPVTSQAPAPAPVTTTEKLAGKTPIEQARTLKDGLSADISIIRKRIADVTISKVDDLKAATDKWNLAFSRTAANDADRLLSKVNTIIDRIERGQSVSEETIAALSDRIASLKDFYKHKITSEADVRARLSDYIKENLPLGERGRLLDALKDAKTEDDILKTISRVDAYAEKSAIKTLKGKIEDFLERTKPRKENGILKGRYTAEIQAELDDIRKNLHMDRADATKQIEKNVQGIIDGTIENIDAALRENDLLKYAGIDEMNSAELEELYDILKAEKGIGSAQNAAKRAAEELDRNLRFAEITSKVTGDKGIIPGREAGAKEALPKATNFVGEFLNKNRSIWGLGDVLMSKSGKPFKETELYQFFKENIFKPRMAESTGRMKILEGMQTDAMRIFGVKKSREWNKILQVMSNDKVNLGTFKTTTGKSVTLEYTKAELLSFYQHIKNPNLDSTFRDGMGWTKEITDSVVNSLTPQEKAWADHLSAYLQEYHSSINQVYRDIFHVDLPQDPFYWPKSRDFTTDVPEYQMFAQEMREHASTLNGALKSTTKNINPLRATDANLVFLNHINQMEFFKAWAKGITNLRKLLADKDFIVAVEQNYGKQILREMRENLDIITRQGAESAKTVRFLDQQRARFSAAVIGLKPYQMLQQMPTMFTALTEMGAKPFMKGVSDFWLNPKAAFDEMMTHPYIKDRYTAGHFERDVRASMGKNRLRPLSGKSNLTDIFYAQMKMGDKFGTLQSYWAKYKDGLAKGLSKTDAMDAAAMMTDRIQNTSSIDTLTSLQNGGSFWKLLTMFQSQPSKYFQIIDNNFRNLRYGRGSKTQAITAIVMAWAVLPATFQFIADGFQFKKSRQARAVVLGPINDLLVAGQVFGTVEDWLAGDNFDYQPTPVLAPIKDLGIAVQKGVSLWNKSFDETKNITWDDMMAFTEAVMKPTGEGFGIPTPYLIQVEKAIRGKTDKGVTQQDWRELVFSRYALEKPKPSQQDKSLANLGLLGTVKPSTKADKLPSITDWSDYFREQKENFKKNLLSDITEANGFDPGAEAAAKAMMAKDTLDSKPNKPLHKIVDDMLDDPNVKYSSIAEYYGDWLTRQTLTSKADILEFDKTHNAKWGNLSEPELKVLLDYEQATPEQRKQMIKDNPLLSVVPTDRWLKAEPDENAYLALMGQAPPLTLAAYNKAVQLAKDLGGPESASEKFLPPRDIASAYFEYKDAKNDAEADLIRAKNPMLDGFLNLNRSDPLNKITTPIPALELKVKNFDLDKEYEGYSTEGSGFYIEDKTKREQAVKALKEANQNWWDDRKRVEALMVGGDIPTDTKVVEAHVAYNRIVGTDDDGIGSSSPEAMLFRADNRNYEAWRTNKAIQRTDPDKKGALELVPIDEADIPKWRLQVKHRADDKSYDDISKKYAGMTDGAINFLPYPEGVRPEFWDSLSAVEKRDRLIAGEHEKMLAENNTYRTNRYRIEAYNKGFSASDVEIYVRYSDATFNEKKRILSENGGKDPAHPTGFALAMINAKKVTDITPADNIKSVEWDNITTKFKDEFDKVESLGNVESVNYIGVAAPGDKDAEDTREKAKLAMFEADAKFKEAWYRREAYGKLFPDTLTDIIVYDDKGNKQVTQGSMVDLFVRYSTQETFYGKQRLLLNNDEFNKLMTADAPKTVPAPEYDIITKQFEPQFDELDKLKGDAYEKRARELRFDSTGKYTEFGIAEITRNAHYNLVPKNLVPKYVEYYKIVGEKEATNKLLKEKWQKYEDAYNAYETDAEKAGFLKNGTKDLPDMAGYVRYRDDKDETNYENVWFLMENPTYYRDVYLNKDIFPEHSTVDFTKVPSREVFALYQIYRGKPLGSARTSYRRSNPDLDAWLVLAKDLQPIDKTPAPKGGWKSPTTAVGNLYDEYVQLKKGGASITALQRFLGEHQDLLTWMKSRDYLNEDGV